jgi:hypothetical protein
MYIVFALIIFFCGYIDEHVRIAYFQFTDLEEEFEEFKRKVELEQAEKEEELAQLRGLLKTMEQQNKHTGNNGEPVQTLCLYFTVVCYVSLLRASPLLYFICHPLRMSDLL